MVQIFSESFFLYGFGEILVGGRYYAYVDLDGCLSANSEKFAFRENAQHPGLQCR